MTPIVLVPGLLCTAEVFTAQVAALWPHGSVTVASTLEGDTMADMARAILAAAPPRFALAGISMGGYVALEIMRQAPGRVLKLALLSTTARPDAPGQSAMRRAMVDQGRSGDFAELVAMALRTNLHPAYEADPALRDVQLRMATTVGVERFGRQTEALIGRVDSRPSLSAIAVPTLVLVGDRDAITPPEQAREMAAAIPGARLVVVADCGHASTLEQPSAVNRALIEWIAEQPAVKPVP